jgi:catechol 2,3-dioxygenase-like lactoylglutathione lyase family enzyme
MARLRHFAGCVKNLEKSAKFYSKVFDLNEVGREAGSGWGRIRYFTSRLGRNRRQAMIGPQFPTVIPRELRGMPPVE